MTRKTNANDGANACDGGKPPHEARASRRKRRGRCGRVRSRPGAAHSKERRKAKGRENRYCVWSNPKPTFVIRHPTAVAEADEEHMSERLHWLLTYTKSSAPSTSQAASEAFVPAQ